MLVSQHLPPDLGPALLRAGLDVRDLVLYANSSCNLRCKHCYLGNELLSRRLEFDAASIGTALNGFDRLDRLTILGGEVFAHTEALTLFRVIDTRSIRERRVTTNLTIWHHEAIATAARNGFQFCVSIDGATAESHDKLRGRGSFRHTTDNLRRLTALGAAIEVTHTVCRPNLDEFPMLLALCRSLGIFSLNLHLVTPQGNAASTTDLTLTPSEWRDFTERTLAKTEPADGAIAVRYPLRYATREEYERLRRSGYHHHAEGSFHSLGDRVVVYPTGELFISSEAFGSDAAIGQMYDDHIDFWIDERSEFWRARSRADFDVAAINPDLAGDAKYPVALSVSFKLTAYC